MLRRSRDSVELIDVSAELPHLTRRPGLKKWKVCYSFNSLLESFGSNDAIIAWCQSRI